MSRSSSWARQALPARLLDKLNLTQNAAFMASSKTLKAQIMGIFKPLLSPFQRMKRANAVGSQTTPVPAETPRDQAIDIIQGNTDVTRVRGTYLLEVDYGQPGPGAGNQYRQCAGRGIPRRSAQLEIRRDPPRFRLAAAAHRRAQQGIDGGRRRSAEFPRGEQSADRQRASSATSPCSRGRARRSGAPRSPAPRRRCARSGWTRAHRGAGHTRRRRRAHGRPDPLRGPRRAHERGGHPPARGAVAPRGVVVTVRAPRRAAPEVGDHRAARTARSSPSDPSLLDASPLPDDATVPEEAGSHVVPLGGGAV